MLRTCSAVDERDALGNQELVGTRALVKTVSDSSSRALTVSSSCASLLSNDDDDDDTNDNNNDSHSRYFHPNTSADDGDDDNDNDAAAERVPLLADDNQRVAALQDETEQLRRQVADLTSALVVRDMEIAALQERCQFLLTSVAQQDEVIAKIYAATAAASDSAPTAAASDSAPTATRSSAPVPIPTGRSASADAQKPRRARGAAGVSALFSSKRASAAKRPPTQPGSTSTTEPAHEMLEAQLDSIGYEPQRVADALESLADGAPLLTRTSSVESAGERSRVGQLDQLLFPSPPKSAPSLFGSAGPSGSLLQRTPPRSTATSPDSALGVGKKSYRHSPFLERASSLTSDEDFAKSAGFLRKANRKLSGRLSVSDFGLLGDDTALFGRASEQSELSEPSATSDQPENDDDNATNNVSQDAGKRVQRRTGSQRNLFAEVDVAAREDARRRKEKQQQQQQAGSGATPRENEEDELTYAEFLERISLPASRDVLNRIRVFVGSILGPRGDGKPPRAADYVDYDFYGHHEFLRRYEQFFRQMDATLAAHPAWRHASEATLAKARDGVEKYVMDKLSDIAFNQLPVCQQWKADDDHLSRRMKLLSFVTPDMLDINPCMRNEVVWSMAEDELRRINSFRAPGDKINCIVRCCSVIFSVLNLSRGDSGNRPGADDFLPVFIYIVLHSQIPRLCSNCEYIAAYRNPADLMSKAGYCFVNLRSAIEFINVLDGSMLSISADEFDCLLSERERLMHEQSGTGRR
ncbi:hypothetical protein PybrP1_005658 [[Pythium] brassicae (nom. inval.)]|nr:hypothetical protein PybrP1_005658 [[Pythium] brassicae (nom. inval.)]